MSGGRGAEAWTRYTPTDPLDNLDDLRQRLHRDAETSTLKASSRIRPKSAPNRSANMARILCSGEKRLHTWTTRDMKRDECDATQHFDAPHKSAQHEHVTENIGMYEFRSSVKYDFHSP